MKLTIVLILTYSALFCFSSIASDYLPHGPASRSINAGHKPSEVTNESIDAYPKKLHDLLLANFDDFYKYKGKTCTLRLEITSAGFLMQVWAIDGDVQLCSRAVDLAKKIKIPSIKNDSVWRSTHGVFDVKL